MKQSNGVPGRSPGWNDPGGGTGGNDRGGDPGGTERDRGPGENHGWIPLRERTPEKADGEKVLVWHAFNGAMLCRPEDWKRNRFYYYWQRIPENGWVQVRERLPTRRDADQYNCVLAEHRLEGFRTAGWHILAEDGGFVRWTPLPEPPEDYKEIRRRL